MATTARPSDKKRHMLPANASSFRTSSREFVRSRGFGPWVSVATSPKGSYRTTDGLSFLSTHLPDMTPQSRRWRRGPQAPEMMLVQTASVDGHESSAKTKSRSCGESKSRRSTVETKASSSLLGPSIQFTMGRFRGLVRV